MGGNKTLNIRHSTFVRSTLIQISWKSIKACSRNSPTNRHTHILYYTERLSAMKTSLFSVKWNSALILVLQATESDKEKQFVNLSIYPALVSMRMLFVKGETNENHLFDLLQLEQMVLTSNDTRQSSYSFHLSWGYKQKIKINMNKL